MRDIAFRFWLGSIKKMSYNVSLIDIATVFSRSENNDSSTVPLQYTGLKDSRNIEIYEGDIIDKKYKFVVVFEDGAFYAKNKYSTAYLLPEIIKRRRIAGIPIEIIGNIYENSNLVEMPSLLS